MAKIKKGTKPGYRKPLSVLEKERPAYKYPARIEFFTTGEIASFERISGKSTHRAYDLFMYRYTEVPQRHPTCPSTKLGMLLPMKREDLEYLSRKSYAKFHYEN